MAAKIAKQQLAATQKELAAKTKEIASLKRAAAQEPSAPVVTSDEPMEEDTDDKCGYKYTLAQHRDLLAIAKAAGDDDDIDKCTKAIAVQVRAKDAAKRPETQILQAKRAVEKAEKRAAKLESATGGLKEAVAAAEAKWQAHLAELAEAKVELDQAKMHRAQLAQSFSLQNPVPAGPITTGPGGNTWNQLFELSLEDGVHAAIEGMPGSFGAVLRAVLGKAAVEKDAVKQAMFEASQAEAAAAHAPHTAVPAAEAAASGANEAAIAAVTATTAATAAPASPAAAAATPTTSPVPESTTHTRPPPLLEGRPTSSTMDLFPDHLASSMGELSAEDEALLARMAAMPQEAVMAQLGRYRSAPY